MRAGLEDDGPGSVELRESLLESVLSRRAGRLDDDLALASGQLRHHADF